MQNGGEIGAITQVLNNLISKKTKKNQEGINLNLI
jgi:hypothetical protein